MNDYEIKRLKGSVLIHAQVPTKKICESIPCRKTLVFRIRNLKWPGRALIVSLEPVSTIKNGQQSLDDLWTEEPIADLEDSIAEDPTLCMRIICRRSTMPLRAMSSPGLARPHTPV